MKPAHGQMYYWRQRGRLEWRFGYCTHLSGGLIRMGNWNGDTQTGPILDPMDIEWRLY